MRIGLVAPPWVPVPPPRYGGTEAVVDTLARGLVRAGHDVVLVAARESTCPVPTKVPLEGAAAPMGDGSVEAGYVLDAYDALADRDVVHDHTLIGPLVAPLVAQRLRAPGRAVLTTLHLGLTPAVRRVVTAVAERVPVVAISHAQAAQVPEVAFARVIHHGLDPAAFPPGPGDGGYVLFLGRMCADKGPDRAIRLARRAPRSGCPRSGPSSPTSSGRCSGRTSTSAARWTPPSAVRCCGGRGPCSTRSVGRSRSGW